VAARANNQPAPAFINAEEGAHTAYSVGLIRVFRDVLNMQGFHSTQLSGHGGVSQANALHDVNQISLAENSDKSISCFSASHLLGREWVHANSSAPLVSWESSKRDEVQSRFYSEKLRNIRFVIRKAIFPQHSCYGQANLLEHAMSKARKDVRHFFRTLNVSSLNQTSRIKLVFFLLDKFPRDLAENFHKFGILDEGDRVEVARGLAKKNESLFFKNILQFNIPCERALLELPNHLMLMEKELPNFIPHKSVDIVAAECGVSVQKLEAFLKRKIGEFVDDARVSSAPRPSAYFPLFDALYNLYMIGSTQGLPLPWIKNLMGFDSFVRHFCPSANAKSLSWIQDNLNVFLRLHVSSALIVHGDRRATLYCSQEMNWGKTLLYAHKLLSHELCVKEHWADSAVLSEFRSLKDNKVLDDVELIFHATGSAALSGIGAQGGIFSANKVLSSGGRVVTGEYVSWINSHTDVSISGGSSGLGDVYTLRHSSLSSSVYTSTRWFDEYPIVFGVNLEKQMHLTKSMGLNVNYFNDRKGEGILTGPSIPLENISFISSPKKNEKDVQAWVHTHCPWVKFVSKEAAELWGLYNKTE
jgi:hypothetical protein